MDAMTTDMKTVKNKSLFYVAILALLLAITAIVAAVVYEHNLKFLLETTRFNNQLTHRELQQLQHFQEATLERLNQQQQQIIQNKTAEMGNHKVWIVAEVNYLARLANYNLSYMHDTNTAAVLLQTADERIASLNDPDLNSVRQQLANDITALQAVDKVDRVGILARLSALQVQVKRLPLISPPSFAIAKKTPEKTPTTESHWHKILDRSLATLHSLVIIRHHQEPIEPILSGEQLLYLQQNLQLELQQAQWAVLHGEKTLYENSLQNVIFSVQHYFASANASTTAFITNVAQLQKMNIQPDLPDLTALLNALTQVEHSSAAAKHN